MHTKKAYITENKLPLPYSIYTYNIGTSAPQATEVPVAQQIIKK